MKTSGSSRRELEIVSSIAEALNSAPSVQEALERTLELESSVDANGEVIASKGWTDLVITPERGIHVVDALLTGLHEPRASHLAMLEAIAGRDTVEKAYAVALEREYLWHEFGDLHLIV